MSKKICRKCGSDMKQGIYHKEGDRLDGEKGWRCLNHLFKQTRRLLFEAGEMCCILGTSKPLGVPNLSLATHQTRN